MKLLFCLLPGVAACLVLCSCVVTSDQPLSSPATAQIDKRLEGDWYSKTGENFHITATDAHWMRVVITPKPANPSRPSLVDESPETYDFFCTKADDQTLLNIKFLGKDKRNQPVTIYMFNRYEISPDGKLLTYRIPEEKAAEAVRAGKLKGEIQQQPKSYLVGNPPHPDIDVNFTDSGAKILAYIRQHGASTLFDESDNALTRTAPQVGQVGG